jgi:hypothetical protein
MEVRATICMALLVAGACRFSVAVGANETDTSTKVSPHREAYFGDLHLHTSYSMDAYLMGTTRVDPNEAYRFAKGEVVEYLGQSIRRREPLDFLAVTDHAELLGLLNTLDDPNSALSRSELGKAIRERSPKAMEMLGFDNSSTSTPRSAEPLPGTDASAIARSAWQRTIDAANRNNRPGEFTAFIGYEWGGEPNNANLHRNVIFKGASAPPPFTAVDSIRPEDLWAWLEKIRQRGYEALAIPHNANASNALMFDWVDSGGAAIDRSYAELRRTNEPLLEIAQTKGASETHPLLSANDEFADYEILDFLAGAHGRESPPQGSYFRNALGRGLVVRGRVGINPFQYGVVGGSDLHTGLTVSSQSDYHGSISRGSLGAGKPSKPEAAALLGTRLEASAPPPFSLRTSSGNLTGVWAERNTRESIYAAFRRRETFATSGTRLRFRFFGSWSFGKQLLNEKDWVAAAYANGVPMGGELPVSRGTPKAPRFAIWAAKDPNSGNLDRVQVIKVWEESGAQKEKVFDAVCAGARVPDPKTGRLPAIGNTVDLKTGQFTDDVGAAELMTVWEDPEFDATRSAAYYLRVLEIPTPRWSTLLAIDNSLPLSKQVPATLQQRGWSSPIWYGASTGTDRGRH